MADFTVIRYGTDSSGRPIRMTRYMRDWWEHVCVRLGFEPTIVQGAFMAGQGADASAGYHDQAGCLDLRVWDRTDAEVRQTIRILREYGAAAWVRDHRHGMDPHIHFVLGTDSPLHPGAAGQWRDYIDGRDGLAGRRPDYEPRPNPLVTTPPGEAMPLTAADLTAVRTVVKEELAKAGDTIRIDSDGDPRTAKFSLSTMLRWIQRSGAPKA